MTQPGIEPRSPRPLANTVIIIAIFSYVFYMIRIGNYIKMSQVFLNISIHSNLQHVYHVTKAVQAMECTCCGW